MGYCSPAQVKKSRTHNYTLRVALLIMPVFLLLRSWRPHKQTLLLLFWVDQPLFESHKLRPNPSEKIHQRRPLGDNICGGIRYFEPAHYEAVPVEFERNKQEEDRVGKSGESKAEGAIKGSLPSTPDDTSFPCTELKPRLKYPAHRLKDACDGKGYPVRKGDLELVEGLRKVHR